MIKPQRAQRTLRKSPLERSTTLVGRCVSLEIPCSILDIHPKSVRNALNKIPE